MLHGFFYAFYSVNDSLLKPVFGMIFYEPRFLFWWLFFMMPGVAQTTRRSINFCRRLR